MGEVVDSTNEEDELNAVRILKSCWRTSSAPREDTSLDTLMPLIKAQLSKEDNRNEESHSPNLRNQTHSSSSSNLQNSLKPGRSSGTSVLNPPKMFRELSNPPKNHITYRLRRVGAQKRRRTARNPQRSGNPAESSALCSTVESQQNQQRESNQDDQQSQRSQENHENSFLTSLKVLKRNFRDTSPVEKLLRTPVKARQRSISSDVEYERVCESVQNLSQAPVFAFDPVTLLNDFDAVLNDEILADLLNESTPEPKNRRSLRRVRQHRIIETSDSDADSDLEERIVTGEFDQPLPVEIIRQLRGTRVRLEHEPVPQHCIDGTRLHRNLTPSQKCEFQRHATLREGPFTPKEDRTIRRNWRRFCEIHDLDIPQERFFKTTYCGRRFMTTSRERTKFAQFLANGLPSRTVHSVFRRFCVLFGFRRLETHRRYTPQEDDNILRYMESSKHVSRKSESLTNLLGQPCSSVWSRYNQLRKKTPTPRQEKPKKKSKVVWTLCLLEKFLHHLMDATISEDVDELKDAIIPTSVWLKLEDILGVQHDDLRILWEQQLHPQLFSPRPIFHNEIKIMLIEYFYVRGVTNTGEFSWSEVARYFDGLTPQFLLKMLPRPMSACREFNIGSMVQNWHHRHLPLLKNQLYDSYLPRLVYEDGKLEVLDDFPPLDRRHRQ